MEKAAPGAAVGIRTGDTDGEEGAKVVMKRRQGTGKYGGEAQKPVPIPPSQGPLLLQGECFYTPGGLAWRGGEVGKP